ERGERAIPLLTQRATRECVALRVSAGTDGLMSLGGMGGSVAAIDDALDFGFGGMQARGDIGAACDVAERAGEALRQRGVVRRAWTRARSVFQLVTEKPIRQLGVFGKRRERRAARRHGAVGAHDRFDA